LSSSPWRAILSIWQVLGKSTSACSRLGLCSGLVSIDEGAWRELRLRSTAGLGKREVAGEEDLRAQEEGKRKQEGADIAVGTCEWEKEPLDAVELLDIGEWY
jgi:hypothetical protein